MTKHVNHGSSITHVMWLTSVDDKVVGRGRAEHGADVWQHLLLHARLGQHHRLTRVEETLPGRVEPLGVWDSLLLLGESERFLADLVILVHLLLQCRWRIPMKLHAIRHTVSTYFLFKLVFISDYVVKMELHLIYCTVYFTKKLLSTVITIFGHYVFGHTLILTNINKKINRQFYL